MIFKRITRTSEKETRFSSTGSKGMFVLWHLAVFRFGSRKELEKKEAEQHLEKEFQEEQDGLHHQQRKRWSRPWLLVVGCHS